MTLAPGTKLGAYEILSLLGAGGMGEVYRARDTALGRDVALKILRPGAVQDADRLRRFRQEAQAAAALNHPNIMAIHFIGDQDGAPYIVSELLEGESLRECLRAGALLMRKSMDYAMQIAEGLAAAHEKSVQAGASSNSPTCPCAIHRTGRSQETTSKEASACRGGSFLPLVKS